MNICEHRRDQRLHSKGRQVAYTAGYICFMRSKHDDTLEANWEQTYLDADRIDYSPANDPVVWRRAICLETWKEIS